MQFDFLSAFLHLLVFIPAVGLHEYCHAKFADMAGDMTPRAQGRVTLNPFAHLDPIGTLMVVFSAASGFGFGWGKPVMVNVGKMRNPRVDHFISVVMGPISNLGQALFWVFIVRFGLVAFDPKAVLDTTYAISSLDRFFSYFAIHSIFMNLAMFVFNLIPIGPLDGHWLVGAMLPPQQRNAWYRFCHGPGMIVFLILVLMPNSPIDWIMQNTVFPMFRVLIGRGF